MKVIIGLGNPGPKYDRTRHNVGFQVASELVSRWVLGGPREKFRSQVFEGNCGGEPVRVLRPLTFMNRSGAAALAVRDFFHLSGEEILVVCDDIHLPLLLWWAIESKTDCRNVSDSCCDSFSTTFWISSSVCPRCFR